MARDSRRVREILKEKKKTKKSGTGLDSVNPLLFALTILYYSK